MKIAIAPTYNMGEITFTYPGTIKFDNQGKVIAGIDDLGKTIWVEILRQENLLALVLQVIK